MNKLFRLMLVVPVGSVFLLTGCAPMPPPEGGYQPPPPPIAQPQGYIYHRVMYGETLGAIAKYYTGREYMWREIAEDNPGIRPNRLMEGDVIKIAYPLAVLHNEQPPFPLRAGGKKVIKKTDKKGRVVEEEVPIEGPEEGFGPK